MLKHIQNNTRKVYFNKKLKLPFFDKKIINYLEKVIKKPKEHNKKTLISEDEIDNSKNSDPETQYEDHGRNENDDNAEACLKENLQMNCIYYFTSNLKHLNSEQLLKLIFIFQ